MENMERSREEIKELISKRKAQGLPIRKLKKALSIKNIAWNKTRSSDDLEQDKATRQALGKPTRQIDDELRSRI
jgi:hypothetical protein